jgi:glycine cleavage system H protein
MPVPKDRRYLQTHEWHKLDGQTVTLGITQFAADELTDITYVKLPAIGATVAAGGVIGEVESVKATSDLYCGVAGTVTAVNTELNTNPGLINADPFERGWILKLKVTNPSEVAKLLSADDYLKKTGH